MGGPLYGGDGDGQDRAIVRPEGIGRCPRYANSPSERSVFQVEARRMAVVPGELDGVGADVLHALEFRSGRMEFGSRIRSPVHSSRHPAHGHWLRIVR